MLKDRDMGFIFLLFILIVCLAAALFAGIFVGLPLCVFDIVRYVLCRHGKYGRMMQRRISPHEYLEFCKRKCMRSIISMIVGFGIGMAISAGMASPAGEIGVFLLTSLLLGLIAGGAICLFRHIFFRWR